MAEEFAAEGRDPIAAVALMFEEAAKGMRRRRYRGGCFAGNLALEASDDRESVRTRVARLLRFWVAEVAALLERGRASGFFRRDLQAGRSAEAILSLFEGALLFSKASRQPAAIDSAREMAVAYLQGFRAEARGAEEDRPGVDPPDRILRIERKAVVRDRGNHRGAYVNRRSELPSGRGVAATSGGS